MARWLSLAALILGVYCYVSLWRHSPFHILALQALMWGLAVWNRRWPLYALALAFPVFGNQPGTLYGLHFVDMTLWLVVGGWVYRRWRAGLPPLVYTPLNPWLALTWIAALASLLPHLREMWRHLAYVGSITHSLFVAYQASAFSPLWTLHAFLDLTLSLLLFFYLLDQWRGRKVRLRLLRNLCIGLAVAMVLGLLDFFGILSLEWFRPLNPEILKFGSKRLQSFFWHSGWFAEWMVLLLPVALAFALCPGRRTGLGRRTVWLVFSLLGGWVTLLTFQRGGWLALASGYGAVAALSAGLHLRSAGGRRVAIRIGIAVCVAAVLLGTVLTILAHRGDTALGRRLREIGALRDRTAIWHSALVMSGRHPILGVGLGRYFLAHNEEFPEGHPFWILDKGEAHNTYLHVLAERGVPAFAVLLGMLCAILWVYTRAWRAVRADSSRARWIVGGLGMMAAWMVYAVPQYMAYIRIVDLTFWMVLATILHATGQVARSKTPSLDRAVRRADRKKRQVLGAALGEVLGAPSGLDSAHAAEKRSLSWAGLWWLVSPVVWVVAISLGLRPWLAHTVEAVSADAASDLGTYAYACFVSAGFFPWLIVAGAIADGLRRPKLALSGLTFAQVVRLEMALAWFCVFTGALVFLLDAPYVLSARRFAALLVLAAVVLNLGLLFARLARRAAGNRAWSGAMARVVLAAWFCATPIAYPGEAFAGWGRWLEMANPMLPPVRISQSILFAQTMPAMRLWFGLVGWSVFFALLSTLTSGAGLRPSARSRATVRPSVEGPAG
ncbi:O-antigen ligase family protein [Candidatus Sumerlaeota bacterium]|nr:O-antigen ligase family protein [Candidatus Sumerlaeota bacterium]